ncbi:unnamed protein product, partial [Sphagnum compactum]
SSRLCCSSRSTRSTRSPGSISRLSSRCCSPSMVRLLSRSSIRCCLRSTSLSHWSRFSCC